MSKSEKYAQNKQKQSKTVLNKYVGDIDIYVDDILYIDYIDVREQQEMDFFTGANATMDYGMVFSPEAAF